MKNINQINQNSLFSRNNTNKKVYTYYEIHWKNGELNSPDYQLVNSSCRTIKGVIRVIRKTCNHSEGSDFKVFEILNGNRKEIGYKKY
jgi:hypothetical protein